MFMNMREMSNGILCFSTFKKKIVYNKTLQVQQKASSSTSEHLISIERKKTRFKRLLCYPTHRMQSNRSSISSIDIFVCSKIIYGYKVERYTFELLWCCSADGNKQHTFMNTKLSSFIFGISCIE